MNQLEPSERDSKKIKVENTEENRRAYRELLFTGKAEWSNYISGVIMYEETLYQKTSSGERFVDLLAKSGIITGIKVDKGTVALPGSPEETATQGLDGLAGRCAEYYKQGARFAKWRAVLKITDTLPSELSVEETAHSLARYAAICQENGLVPIVEPEILMDGTHTLARCAQVTENVISACYRALNLHRVFLEGTLLKPNMVSPGYSNPEFKTVTPEQVAIATVTVLRRSVPPAVPGVMFLSGGHGEEEATLFLNAMNQVKTTRPWSLSFSFGRALQASCLDAWKGQKENVPAAQEAFITRAKANSEAQQGKYAGGSGTSKDLFEQGYVY